MASTQGCVGAAAIATRTHHQYVVLFVARVQIIQYNVHDIVGSGVGVEVDYTWLTLSMLHRAYRASSSERLACPVQYVRVQQSTGPAQ